MDFSSSKKLLLGLVISGMLVSNVQADGIVETIKSFTKDAKMPSNATMGVAAATIFATTSILIALKQEIQPEIQTHNPVLKIWDWYLRVFCGQASKKSQKGYLTKTHAHMNEDGTINFDADLNIKDCYSASSGYVGNALSWYDANEKDVKKAVGIGAIPAALFLGYMQITSLKDLLVQHVSKAPYGGELLAKAS